MSLKYHVDYNQVTRSSSHKDNFLKTTQIVSLIHICLRESWICIFCSIIKIIAIHHITCRWVKLAWSTEDNAKWLYQDIYLISNHVSNIPVNGANDLQPLLYPYIIPLNLVCDIGNFIFSITINSPGKLWIDSPLI